MRVFVSYSFADSELHLLTLLFEKLRQDGNTVESSDSHFTHESEYKIYNSDLFIGIITEESESIDKVISEWEIAKLKNIQTIMVIEEGVSVVKDMRESIFFNRLDSTSAIDRLFALPSLSQKERGLSELLIGAGIIVGIAALIALLAKSDGE